MAFSCIGLYDSCHNSHSTLQIARGGIFILYGCFFVCIFPRRYFQRPSVSVQLSGAHNGNRAVVSIRASGERRGSAHDVRLGMPKPWMAVLAVPAVKLPQGVTGCLQLLDLQFLSTDSCTDSEEAGNSRTHQMQSRNPLDKNSYPSAICAWM